MYNADKEEVSVITNKELLFLVAVFIFILVQLYPKNILQKIIEDDHSNYALTMIYLKDLLKHNPNDTMLQLVYLKKKMQVRDINISIPLAKKLMHAKKEYVRDGATLLAFQANMIQYFQLKNHKKKKQLYPTIQKLFSIIYTKKLYDTNASKWYYNASFVKNNPAKYYFVKKLLKEEPKNVTLLKNAYFLALEFSDKKNAHNYLQKLLLYDTKNPKQWVMTKYYILIRYKKYHEAQLTLEKNANKALKIKKTLAQFYLMRSMYKKASKTYLQLADNVKNQKEHNFYIQKAIQALQAGNLLTRASELAHKYEMQYIKNIMMRQFILKIYLAAGKLNLADKYAKKILYQKGIL